MDSSHKQWLLHAVDLATQHMLKGEGGPFGAVVVKDNKIIAEGWNMVTSTNDPTAHAEVTAIRRACDVLDTFQLEGCILYSSCEPCPMCLGAIYWARPQALYYTATRQDAAKAGFDDSFIYDEVPLPPEKRSIPCVHIPLLESTESFNKWIKNQNKTEY